MTTLAACLLGGSASSRSICSISDIFLYSPPHEKDFEIGRKPISNPKSEIENWTVSECDVQFKISDFGFEMGFRPISKCLLLRHHLPWTNTFGPSSKSTSILVPSLTAVATPTPKLGCFKTSPGS